MKTTVTEIMVSHLWGAVQHCHRNPDLRLDARRLGWIHWRQRSVIGLMNAIKQAPSGLLMKKAGTTIKCSGTVIPSIMFTIAAIFASPPSAFSKFKAVHTRSESRLVGNCYDYLYLVNSPNVSEAMSLCFATSKNVIITTRFGEESTFEAAWYRNRNELHFRPSPEFRRGGQTCRVSKSHIVNAIYLECEKHKVLLSGTWIKR